MTNYLYWSHVGDQYFLSDPPLYLSTHHCITHYGTKTKSSGNMSPLYWWLQWNNLKKHFDLNEPEWEIFFHFFFLRNDTIRSVVYSCTHTHIHIYYNANILGTQTLCDMRTRDLRSDLAQWNLFSVHKKIYMHSCGATVFIALYNNNTHARFIGRVIYFLAVHFIPGMEIFSNVTSQKLSTFFPPDIKLLKKYYKYII